MNDFCREGPRRRTQRIDIEALCWELVDGKQQGGLAVDLSPEGLRVERPYAGGPTHRTLLLEIEVPGIDELVWARADACFDVLVRPTTPMAGGAMGLVRRTGYRIVAAAARDLRMLEEYVVETHRVQQAVYESYAA